ncbi:MAG TPA: 3D domain-containing protein [Gudongella oleilytica]|jgi:uncharacterized protein YabE (DUF348 family)|nr:3D domain-containing protein [Gudongella oleilytica]
MDNNRTKMVGKVKVLLLLAIAMTLSLGVNFFQGNEVSLNVDGEIIKMVSYSSTVEELLEEEGIKLRRGAVVEPGLDALIKEKLEITIINPKDYTLIIGDETIKFRSLSSKVSDVLADADIAVGLKDFTKPSLDSTVKDGDTIELFRVVEVPRVEEAVIPFEKEIISNERLDRGVVNVLQEGKDGLRRSHINDIYVNGVFTSSVMISDTILEEPVSQVIEKGVNNIVLTSRGETRFKDTMILEATAYDLSYASTGKRPGDRYYGITATGTRARPGTVAVDPRVIPLGTKLYIQSLDGTKDYGFAIAEDVGGAIKGEKIDLFFNSATDVRYFGRRDVKVYILD